MNVGDCYRLLELDRGATLADIKAAYRRLARAWHPDLNDRDNAHDRFIALRDAYEKLCSIAPLERGEVAEMLDRRRTAARGSEPPVTAAPRTAPPSAPRSTPPATPPPPPATGAPLSELERQLKYDAYEKLRALLAEERYPRAVALVEGLAERLPDDPEVRQWQAVTYQRCGRDHLDCDRLAKARIYLTKAYRTDPHNRELLGAVSQDLRRLERLYQQKRQKSSGRTVAIPDFFKTKHDPEHPTVRPTRPKRQRSAGKKAQKKTGSAGKFGAKRASKRKK